MSLDIHLYNATREPAYKALQVMTGRFEKWADHAEKAAYAIKDEKARTMAIEKFTKDHNRRFDELKAIADHFGEGNKILQQLINDNQSMYKEAYKRGQHDALKPLPSSYPNKLRYGNNREQFRAAHELETIKAFPTHY